METQKVIIYRSQSEVLADEFFQDNPCFILGFVGLLIIVFLIYLIRRKNLI